MPADELPNFREGGGYIALYEWAEGRGLRPVRMPYRSPEQCFKWGYRGGLVILSGPSPSLYKNGERKRHAVVGLPTPDGSAFEMVHDPDPSRMGLHGPADMITWFVPTDRPKRWLERVVLWAHQRHQERARMR